MDAPPPVVPDCLGELTRAGVEARAAQLPRSPRGAACSAPEVVTYLRGPEGVVWSPRPVFTCGMALGLARFERLLVAKAREHLGSPVVQVTQLGTWSCRRMARYALPSEHSFANAIDLSEFHLQSGRRISVLRDFGSTAADAPAPTTPGARFLRETARTAFDEALFSVVLTPFWDSLHRDHLHLDLAPYRADGAGR